MQKHGDCESLQKSAAKGAAVDEDSGLARVVAAWPDLPEEIKTAVLALVESGTAGR